MHSFKLKMHQIHFRLGLCPGVAQIPLPFVMLKQHHQSTEEKILQD